MNSMKLKNFVMGAIAASTVSMMACNDNEGDEAYMPNLKKAIKK